ncbi:hypothetical protein GCM10010272_59610 [Streptomyces lateritius]|nr:hypothetical protein GCM10010272_59610 [Streptomyces lateritius]
MRRPRMLFAGGENEDVTGGAPGLQEEIHRFLGGVERAVGGGGDQLELRTGSLLGTILRAGGRGLPGTGVRALRGRGGPGRSGDGTPWTRRRRGTRTGDGTRGRRGVAGGRGAGTLGTLVNLRLLGDERHGWMSIKRRCAGLRRVGTIVRPGC